MSTKVDKSILELTQKRSVGGEEIETEHSDQLNDKNVQKKTFTT